MKETQVVPSDKACLNLPGDKIVFNNVEGIFGGKKLGIFHDEVLYFPAHTYNDKSKRKPDFQKLRKFWMLRRSLGRMTMKSTRTVLGHLLLRSLARSELMRKSFFVCELNGAIS